MKDKENKFSALILGMVFIGAILISLFHLSPTIAGIIGALIGLVFYMIKKEQ